MNRIFPTPKGWDGSNLAQECAPRKGVVSMANWLNRQYADIRGNFKWGILMFLWWLITTFAKKAISLIPHIPEALVYTILCVASLIVFVLIAKLIARSQTADYQKSGTERVHERGPSFYEDDPHYKTVRGHKFRNETVELDGKRFEDCEFENSTILFHGNAPTEMIDPKFLGSLQIASDDPAINNFITISEVLRGVPHVAKFDCVAVDEQGHKKEHISSWTRVRFKPVTDAKDSPEPKQNIYVGPSGTPIRLVNEKLRVDLKLFASVTAELVHVKLELGNSKIVKVTLTDAEPHQLEAGKIFSKTIERSLTEDEVQTVRSELIQVQGTAKFAGNLEVPFHFQTNPLLV